MLPEPIFLNVHMYGVMIAIGLLCAMLLIHPLGKRNGQNEKFLDFAFYNALFSIMAGFGSASLFQSLYDYIEDPSQGFSLGSGMTFLGGLIGGVVIFLSVYFIARPRLTGRVMTLLPFAPCIITIAHAFGRVGCFFAGCCYGKPTDSWLGVQFPRLRHPVHPTQLYEAAFLFLLFGVCMLLFLKWRFRHTMSVYLCAYGVFRFLLEFLRDDHRGSLLGNTLSPSQIWSIGMVVIGIALIIVFERFFPRTALTPDLAPPSEAAGEAPTEAPVTEE